MAEAAKIYPAEISRRPIRVGTPLVKKTATAAAENFKLCPFPGQSLNCHISVSVEKWLHFTIYGENWHKLPPGKCTIISTMALICSAMYAMEKGVGVLRASKFQLSFACMHDLSYWFLNGFGCSQSRYINLI